MAHLLRCCFMLWFRTSLRLVSYRAPQITYWNSDFVRRALRTQMYRAILIPNSCSPLSPLFRGISRMSAGKRPPKQSKNRRFKVWPSVFQKKPQPDFEDLRGAERIDPPGRLSYNRHSQSTTDGSQPNSASATLPPYYGESKQTAPFGCAQSISPIS